MAETFGIEAAVGTEEHPDAFLGESYGDEYAEYYDAGTEGLAPSTGAAQRTGRRKEAVARVRVVPGSGQWKINDRGLEDYFPNKVHQQIVREPLRIVEALERFDVTARLHGGGVSGQAGALRLGIARALTEVDRDFRPALKRAGFLTRDARAKERRKYGLKKARKAPQYSKR